MKMLKKVNVILWAAALSISIAISNVKAQEGYGIAISTNQASYSAGDTLVESVHLWNLTSQDKFFDIKNWIDCPAPIGLVSIYNLPMFPVPAGFYFEGDIFDYTFDGSEPQGDYMLGARLINYITGDIESEDFVNFNFGPPGEKEWTYMVYMAADNDLESAGIDDFLEMAQVGSSENVNIVVQFDRWIGEGGYGNWTICHRFLITEGMTPYEFNAISDWGDGMGGREVDMGNPETLKNFVEWAMTNYPANKYALILWNHGSGILKRLEQKLVFKGVCWDDTSWSNLEMDDVESALSGKVVDLIGYDACLMGMIEVAYEAKASSQVMVASEEVEPWDGWPYDPVMAALVNNPTMDAASLGSITVKEYIDSYPWDSIVTLSAIYTTSLLDDLAAKVSAFADAMVASGEWSAIESARAAVESFWYPEHIDLYDFGLEVYIRVTDTAVKNAAIDLGNAINAIVIAEEHLSGHPDAHGIAIYFPYYGSPSAYDNTNFAQDTTWDEFLDAYNANTT
jgi:hypothetical protein